MLLWELVGLLPDKRWLSILEFLLVRHSQVALSSLYKILFSFHPSIFVLDLKNLDSLKWSGPRTSGDTDNTALPHFHFLFSLVLHPTFSP